LGLPESEESKILTIERRIALESNTALFDAADKELSTRRIDEITQAHSIANSVYTPHLVELSRSDSHFKVTAVAAGGRHSIFVDESGAAWSSGLGTKNRHKEENRVCFRAVCFRV